MVDHSRKYLSRFAWTGTSALSRAKWKIFRIASRDDMARWCLGVLVPGVDLVPDGEKAGFLKFSIRARSRPFLAISLRWPMRYSDDCHSLIMIIATFKPVL